ncbi:unnamed protein product [Orchesella dallaii]|uniref:Sodium channel protein Nach n=1 Tax=Orchesella dallaii TaxID=48710 RepID=A0ABP1RYA3_9HEXA
MAKIFNRRLIYALGDTSIQSNQIRKHIPFDKLRAEHQMIVSLVRHLSHVSILYIYSFMMSIVLELALGIYLLFDMFLSTEYHSNVEGPFISERGTIELAVPIRETTLQEEWIVYSFAMIGITWLTYWLFGDVVHKAGEYLNAAGDYVRRHGLISCGSSKERRFILSIMNSCASRDGHWIGRNFNFNRLFLVSLVSVVIGCSMVTISYRPDRLNLDSYEICNADGVCTHIRASKLVESQAYQFYRPPQLPLPQYPSPSYNKTLPPFNESVSAEYFAPDIFIDYPPCSSFGSYPNTESDVSVVCPASWEGNRNLTEIKLPLVYKYMLVKFPSVSAEFNFHGVIRDLFYSMENGTSKCRTRDFPFYNFPYTDAFGVPPSTPPTDCFGSVVDVKIKDDCGNFPFSTINAKTGKKVEAKLKPVYVPNLSGLDSVEESLVCCYEYGGFAGSEAQAGVCNVANAPTFEVVCETGLGRRRLQPAHIKEDYRKLLARLRYLNIYHAGMGSSLEYIRKNEETIRGCLCKLDEPEISLNSEEHCACVGLQLPPCLPGYVTGKDEDYTHSCGAVKVPLLFKMNSDFTLVFPGEHERYKDVCVGDKFNDRFSHNDTLSYDYPCALPVPHPPDPIRLMDCAGKPILKVEKDDCSNWNVRTPDLTNQGQMLRTLLRLKVVNYNLAKKEFVSTEEKNRAFVCCFEYQGQAFQSPHQVKYCNVPSVETMNNDGWCGAVARNNGIRNSAPFDIKLHTQLHRKLELTVRYHEVKGRPDWILEKNEVLKRCMCTNMIAGANQASYLDWVRKCIPLIVPPVDADKANVFRSIIHKCPHKWSSSYPQKEIKTPLIFTIENDIWESHDRFRKTLDSSVTSKCHLNEEYEEVYKNDGNPIIYDGNLNSLPLGETDDCWNIPQRTFVSATGTSLVSPQVRLSPEYTMARYDANAFKESTSVHCCYSFSNFPSEQRLICSLPNAASVKKHCNSKPKSERRLEHEYQLTRRLAVFENGANYIGDQVINSDYSLTLDSPLEKIWRKCICEANSSSDSTHNMCRKEYLPPCVKSKGQLGSITKFEKMFTQCSAQWTGITYTINLPIIMEFFENGSFAQIPLFEEGGVPKQCPTNNTNVVTLRSKLSDCYGEEIEYGIDDCNLPSVHTPNRNEFWQRMESTKELIGVNHLPGLETSEDFFCCNKYGISLIYDVIVCNQPNPDAITRNCKFERDPFLTRYADKLRNRRGRGFDPLTLDTAFINPTRAAWTKCLCYGLSNECENATNRQLHPCLIAQHSSEMGLAEFSKCRTNKSTPWEDLQPSYNSYPIILQNIDDTDYRQVMLLGQGRCLSVDGSPPFPPDTIYQLSPNSHLPIVDCRERPIPTFFGDDCGTPIIELPPGSKRGLIIRVSAELFREFKVAKCVVEYQFGNQAEYFNMPSHEDYNRKCKGGPANFYNFFDIYNRIKSKVERTRMETDSKVVHCLCYHLEYLRRKHFGSPASEQECRAYFETFCQKPGSC